MAPATRRSKVISPLPALALRPGVLPAPAVVPGDQSATSSKVLAQVDKRERSLGAPVVLDVPDP
jgi:hypothetical protein